VSRRRRAAATELLTYPDRLDQVPFASVRQAFDLGAVAVGATVYLGAPESMRQLQEVRGELLHGQRRADQLRWRINGQG
jgi:DhnA family fructose-bisphosphate aldolase class Ia